MDERSEDYLEFLAWTDNDLSHLGEYESYDWAEGELEEGVPVRHEPERGFLIEGGKRNA